MPTVMHLLVVLAVFTGPLFANDGYVVTTPGKPGTGGLVPALVGTGSLTPGSMGNAILLGDSLPHSTAVLVVGFSELAAPFMGGILGPSPDQLFFGFSTDASGNSQLPFSLPGNTPVGFEVFVQFWIDDPGVFAGFSASNTLSITMQAPAPLGALFPGALYPAGNSPHSVVVADLNNDGVLDLAVTNSSHGKVSVLLGAGRGTFGAEQSFDSGSGVPRSLAVADLDADGVLDLAVTNSLPDGVWVLLGAGDGTFGTAQSFAVGNNPRSVAIADLDADTILDLAVTNGASDNVSVLLGAGDGTFDAALNFAAKMLPVSLAIADLDADGALDLVIANVNSGEVSVLLNQLLN